jgi:uncharacterized repeat protein (TIGR01451 family)
MQGIGKPAGSAGWRRKSPVRLVFALLMSLVLMQNAFAQIVNTVTASGQYGGQTITATASESVTVAGSSGDGGGSELRMEKTAGVAQVSLGQAVPYTITLSNPGSADRDGVDVVDRMPAGFTYLQGSGTLGNASMEPSVNANELVWRNISVPAQGSVTLTLSLVAGAAMLTPEIVNLGFARDASTGKVLSKTATAKVRVRTDPVFDCTDIIGRVYDDANRDGYLQDGEKGIAGVRIATARGLLVTTDSFGRYSIACADEPRQGIGSNFILKVDERTLPQGYSVTSGNPATIRLTRGKLAKLDFGAAGLRLVEVELDARAFVPGGTQLAPQGIAAVDAVLRQLADEPSRLRITYSAERNATSELSDNRLKLLESLVSSAWKARSGAYELSIETVVKVQ